MTLTSKERVQRAIQGLNQEQKQAIQNHSFFHHPLLIYAGAGSGKTRVLTLRVAYLVTHLQVQPNRILAITFTNKATDEMVRRLNQYIGEDDASHVWVSTFHAMCVKMLRYFGPRIGLSSDFSILDQQDQLTMIRHCFRDLRIPIEQGMDRKAMHSISQFKNEVRSVYDVKSIAIEPDQVMLANVYECYEQKLMQNHSLDFDGLLVSTIQLFEQHPDVLQYYQQLFQYIHVDEYQDTNRAQYLICTKLASQHQRICVVGDTDQAIYGWRGADIRNIMDFKVDFPTANTVYLTENYRSTKRILQAANKVVERNTQRVSKVMTTQNPDGSPIRIHQANSDIEEAHFVTQMIKYYLQTGYKQQDIVILYRTNAQSRTFEEQFSTNGIAYRVVGGMGYYERKEIKDLLAYLRSIAYPDEDISLLRFLSVPRRGIGQKTEEELEKHARSKGCSLQSALYDADDLPIYKNAKDGLKLALKQLQGWQQEMTQVSLSELIESVLIDSGLREAYEREGGPEAESRIENLNEFLSLGRQFEIQHGNPTLQDLLMEINTLTMASKSNTNEDDRVTLMTTHSAKGLEYPIVFVVGMEEGLFPHGLALQENGLEEERRLMYVAMTRAEKELILTHTKERFWQGNTSRFKPSRFLKEIPTAFVEHINKPFHVISKNAAYQVGDRVKHKLWQEGTVIDFIDGKEPEIHVSFPGIGIKRLLIHLAPIQKVK